MAELKLPVSEEEIRKLKVGDFVELTGRMITGRDAAHKKMVDILAQGESLPVDLAGRFIYYVGPVDPIGDEVVGPAGPTTAGGTGTGRLVDACLRRHAGVIARHPRRQPNVASRRCGEHFVYRHR